MALSFERWRALLVCCVAAVSLGACAQQGGLAQQGGGTQVVQLPAEAPPEPVAPPPPDWRPFFQNVEKGAILVSLNARVLSHWGPGGSSYTEYPIAVPRSAELTRTGRTEIVRKRRNPSWRPTPDMLKRNPDLPEYVGPGPHNPLGERAMYFGWRYYAVHGTNNPASIGTRATSGCFRLFPDDVAELFEKVPVGTPVLVSYEGIDAARPLVAEIAQSSAPDVR